MIRSTGIAAVLAVLMMVGLTSQAHAQEPAKLVGTASCIDAQGNYVITYTLTLALAPGETASAENPPADFDGLDLVGDPQGDNYPFSTEAGNLFTAQWGTLKNGANVETRPIDTKLYNPLTLQSAGRVKTSTGRSTEIDISVYRPAACPA